jgi:hypothetical protein
MSCAFGRIPDQLQIGQVADEKIPTSSQAVLDAVRGLSGYFSDDTDGFVFGIEESKNLQVLGLTRSGQGLVTAFQGSKRVQASFFGSLFELTRKAAFVFDRIGILALPSEMSAGRVVCDSEDPGRKTGSALVGRNRSMDLKEGVLRDVFGIGPVSTASHRKAEDTIAVVLVELLKTSAFTIGESLDERLIGVDESLLSRIFHGFAPVFDGVCRVGFAGALIEVRLSDWSPILVRGLSPNC